MYYKKFIDFLKKYNIYDEETINYWKENRILFDYRDEEKRWLIGCYYEYKNDRLEKISLAVPFIDNDITNLINIHEYIHLLLLYNNLGKKYYPGDEKEVLPFLYELLYIKENKTEELINYHKFLNKTIIKENKKEYIIALHLSDAILKSYNKDNIFKLEKKIKRLVKKNKKE